MTTLILDAPKTRAVRHLLTASALADCRGTPGRIELDRNRLTIQGLRTWGWSHGEKILVEIVEHIAYGYPWPTGVSVYLDQHQRRIVHEAMECLGIGAR